MGIGRRGDGGGLPTVDVGGVASRIFGKPNAKGAASCLCLVPALHHFLQRGVTSSMRFRLPIKIHCKGIHIL